MRTAIFAMFGALFLAGCGVDGAPIPPEPKADSGAGVNGGL